MKKTNYLTYVVIFTLFFTVTAMFLVSNTYAKYISVSAGSDSAVVAKWSFVVNDKDIATLADNESINFDLFNTIYDSDGTDEEDVADGLIAPGTSGNFEFVLQNLSDVTAQYSIEFDAVNENNIPIEYSLNGSDWFYEISAINIRKSDETVLAIGSEPKKIAVMWRWAFEDNDARDTELGNLDNATIIVNAIVTAVQVDQLYSEELAQKYSLRYYEDIYEAVETINNASYEESLTTTKEQASAAVYLDENDMPNLVILKDKTLANAINLSSDMILDLAGRSLRFNSDTGINVTSANVTVDGSIDGSELILNNTKTNLVKLDSSTLSLNGGVYKTTSSNGGTEKQPNATILVGNSSNLKVNNAKIIANETDDGTIAGILVESGGAATVSNSNIEVSSFNSLGNDGIRNKGTMTISNTKVHAYANYTANAAGTNYATNSRGINNEGTMTLKNCNVYGAHSGVRNPGTLYIDGGTYEGYGHGGIYFAGSNTTSYVQNATISYTAMKVGYADRVAGTNSAGFYIGSASNVIVYMDNCKASGPLYPFVLRSSGGEKNNAIYISNSEINEDRTRYPRNDGSTNRIYIGVGNNFGIKDVYKEAYAEETGVDYSTLFPEY